MFSVRYCRAGYLRSLSFVLAAAIALLAPAPSIALEPPLSPQGKPELHLLHGVVGPEETIYVRVRNGPTETRGPMPSINVVGTASVRPLVRLDLRRVAPIGDFDRWYALPPQPPGSYAVRLDRAHVTLASVPLRVEAGRHAPRAKAFADLLLGYAAAGASRYREPFGKLPGSIKLQSVDPSIMLGDPGPGPFRVRRNPELRFLSLPKGSSVTVGFAGVQIVDGSGPDFAVRSVDPSDSAGEVAEIHVSTDLKSFKRVGTIVAGGAQLIDLQGLGLTDPVRAIRVTGLDLRGSFPGFDLISVEAINHELSGSGGGSAAGL